MKSRRSMSSAGAWTFQFWLLVLCSLTCAAADAETLYGGFRNPPRSDSLMPYWFWNGDMTSAESRRQMREMMAQGVHQAVVFPWGGMKPDSLSEEYWRQVGATLRDVVFAREQTVPSPPQAQTKRLTVAIPPSAVSLEMPAFRKPFRLAIDGKTVSATPRAKVPLAATAKACVFEIEGGDEPERPVAFGSGTVPFTPQCWTDSALAHYSGSAIYETEFELPRSALNRKMMPGLGEVGLAAEVWLNGKKVGERAWRPFRFDVSKTARPGRNSLRIRVANSNAGWQSQGGTIYGKGSWGLKYNTERDRLATLHPNGLEGPVQIKVWK